MKWKAAVIALALCMGHAAKAQSESCRPDRAVFLGGAVPVTVPVEIADDPQERARGLMFRRHLAPGTGMLFIYEAPQRVSFWMRNTPSSLDILYIDPQGRIVSIASHATPFSEAPIPSNGAANGVLELRAGRAAEINAKPGDKVLHPYFKP